MAQKKRLPESWQEFVEAFNELDAESKEKLAPILYEALVKLGKIEPDPEIEALDKKMKEELRMAKEAEQRAEELKKEIEELKRENERLKGKNPRNAGRKADGEAFAESFKKFVKLYESQKSINEILKETGISRRTYYRYKKIYQEKETNHEPE